MINWNNWDIEEKEENEIKILFDLDNEIYPQFNKFNINDRAEIIFNNKSYHAIVINKLKNHFITFEFDDFIDGHNGINAHNEYRNGKKGHCWNYGNYKTNDINWLLRKLKKLDT
jgi:hypothetical protein